MGSTYEYSTTPYSDQTVDNIVGQDGVVDQLEELAIDISNNDLIHNLHQRIEDSLAYWNKPTSHNLKYRRDKNVNWHLGHHRDKTYMFAYQVPYTDNEIFVGVEALVSYLTSQPPRCEVTPGDNELESRILSQDVEDILNQLADLYDLRSESESVVRNLLLKFFGCIKFWWDEDKKEICFGSVDPANLIIDKNVTKGKNPGFICQVMKSEVGEILSRFPDKKSEIFRTLGRTNASTKLLAQTVVWREVWFTSWKDNKPVECCASYFQDVVLEKYKNPNWIYANPGSNILKQPLKPYIPFNFINDGNHWIDNTTAVEQAGPLQEILNKRGQQILENADTANGVQVFDADAINSDAASNLTGDPNQKILLEAHKKGMTLEQAIMQLPPHMLPNYVIEDKQDLRTTIHNILGTPSQFTGTNAQDDNTDTLGQSMMIKNQATGRQDAIVRALASGYKRFFEYLGQMVKVYYDEKHYFAIKGKDGEMVEVEMKSDRMKEGITIAIENGSFLPPDKQTTANIAMNLSKEGMIGPRYLYKDLGLKEIQDRLDDLIEWKTNPMAVSEAEKNANADRDAFVDFTAIMGGEKIEPRDNPSPEHLNTHRSQLLLPKFRNAKKNRTQILDQQSMLDEMAQQEAAAHTLPLNGQSPQPPMQPGMMPPGAGAPPSPQSQPPMAPPPMPPQGPPMSVQTLMG